jgi:hypothetical protein
VRFVALYPWCLLSWSPGRSTLRGVLKQHESLYVSHALLACETKWMATRLFLSNPISNICVFKYWLDKVAMWIILENVRQVSSLACLLHYSDPILLCTCLWLQHILVQKNRIFNFMRSSISQMGQVTVESTVHIAMIAHLRVVLHT